MQRVKGWDDEKSGVKRGEAMINVNLSESVSEIFTLLAGPIGPGQLDVQYRAAAVVTAVLREPRHLSAQVIGVQ